MHEFLDQRADDHDADADRHGIPANGRIDIEHNLFARFLADTFGAGCRRNQAGREIAGRRGEEPRAHDERGHMCRAQPVHCR